jgi:thiol-disulfide isomerase/thioredoxin
VTTATRAAFALIAATAAAGGVSCVGPMSCDPDEVLSQAAARYRDTRSLTDTARYDVRVPGAEPHEEVVEFGYDKDLEAYLRMPGLYLMHAGKNQLVTRSDGARETDPYLVTPRTGNLQATADAAFEGQGSPLVPAPLLLREATTADERAQSFRSKLLAPLRATACSVIASEGARSHEVTLVAENGRVRAHFDAAAGWLRQLDLEIVPSPGAEAIRAQARFQPLVGGVPPPLPRMSAANQRVERLAQLAGAEEREPAASLAAVTLTDLDGKSVRLADFRGQIVIVEFWARWCAPCRVTLPAIEKFWKRTRERKMPVRVLLVNTLEDFASPEEARAEIRRYLGWAKIGLPSLRDPKSALHGQVGGGLPLTLVVGPDGELVEKHAGFKPDLEARLQHRIDALLADR